MQKWYGNKDSGKNSKLGERERLKEVLKVYMPRDQYLFNRGWGLECENVIPVIGVQIPVDGQLFKTSTSNRFFNLAHPYTNFLMSRPLERSNNWVRS